jgi:hypothetical protein
MPRDLHPRCQLVAGKVLDAVVIGSADARDLVRFAVERCDLRVVMAVVRVRDLDRVGGQLRDVAEEFLRYLLYDFARRIRTATSAVESERPFARRTEACAESCTRLVYMGRDEDSGLPADESLPLSERAVELELLLPGAILVSGKGLRIRVRGVDPIDLGGLRVWREDRQQVDPRGAELTANDTRLDPGEDRDVIPLLRRLGDRAGIAALQVVGNADDAIVLDEVIGNPSMPADPRNFALSFAAASPGERPQSWLSGE